MIEISVSNFYSFHNFALDMTKSIVEKVKINNKTNSNEIEYL
jgi:hypothetical protein